MLERMEGFTDKPNNRERDVAQGNLLWPTIFNVVVNAMVRHWESLMEYGSDRDGSSSNEVAHPA